MLPVKGTEAGSQDRQPEIRDWAAHMQQGIPLMTAGAATHLSGPNSECRPSLPCLRPLLPKTADLGSCEGLRRPPLRRP
jgi:hypothetical protein